MVPFALSQRLNWLDTSRRVALVSFFGQLFFFVPVMTPYLQGKGLSLVQVAGMQTALMISQLVMEVPTGILADRVGHRRSYQIALTFVALAEVATLLAATYPQFLVAQFLAGTGFAFASGSVDAYIYESLPPTDRTARMQRAKGRVGGALQLASLVAYGVGAWITRELTMGRMRFTLWLDVVFISFAAVLGFLILEEPARRVHDERHGSLALLRRGWTTIRHSAELQRLVLLAVLTNAFTAQLLVFYQAWFLEVETAPLWLGLGLALGSAAAFFTQIHAWRLPRIFGDRVGLAVGTVTPGVLYLLMAVTRDPALAVVLFIVQWGAVQLTIPLFAGLFNRHIPEGARATTLSLISGATTLYVSAGGLLLGWLAERSLSLMFALTGAVIVAGSALVFTLRDAETGR